MQMSIEDWGLAVVPESCVSLSLHLEVGLRGQWPRSTYVVELPYGYVFYSLAVARTGVGRVTVECEVTDVYL